MMYKSEPSQVFRPASKRPLSGKNMAEQTGAPRAPVCIHPKQDVTSQRRLHLLIA
jgi:hypothetical protein